jgi:hypothetical protein
VIRNKERINKVSISNLRIPIICLGLLYGNVSVAGVYGQENWGQMYWGDNAATSPTGLPSIESLSVTDNQVTIVIDSFPTGTGADGWSAVTSYNVTCGDVSVTTQESSVVLQGLESGTEYSCTVSANNSFGAGPALARFVTTTGGSGSLNIVLVCAATNQCGLS